MIIFTSICANYGHKARVLARSVKEHIPDARFFLCLTEREVPDALRADTCFDRIVLSREIWEGNFDSFIFKHEIVEASTAVKGAFFQWLQRNFPQEEMYVYLDPDCCVYDDFPELREALSRKPAVFCPHLLHPGNIAMELSSTAHGVYNLGFLAVNHSEEARRLIDWWAERLSLYCYEDIARGIFTDQKWMDLAPCFFDVEIFHHYGYDLAPWGLKGIRVEKKDGKWFIQGQSLRFIHYSGFGRVAEQCMDQWLAEEGQLFRELYREYEQKHAAADSDQVSRTPWSYASYHNGEKIAFQVRRCYRETSDLMTKEEDPFSRSNAYFEEECGLTLKGRIRKIRRRSREVYQEQGIGGVFRKAVAKIRRENDEG